jgi:NADP-dependent 3-hydroxy acid dehydrogenase YdfG
MMRGHVCRGIQGCGDHAMAALEGQVAIVTGGGTGVGAAVALALAVAKANICLIGRRPEALETVAGEVRRLGGEATCFAVDLANESEQLSLTDELIRKLPHLDILVQNAALHVASPIEAAAIEDLDRHYRINVRAPYVLTKALLPMLIARCGQVVFINSSSGIAAKPLTSQYDATKHALRALADSLRAEVNPAGVRVLTVYLGRTASNMQAQIHEMESRPYRPDRLLQPGDVASVILHALGLPRTAEVTDIHIRPMIGPG